MKPYVTVVGAGLAGTECAYQLAQRGVAVELIEQKPLARSPAHCSDALAELVCSNSFRSTALSNAVGLLKHEMRRCGSLTMEVGDMVRVPAGGAMAVDRVLFSAEVTRRMQSHSNIQVASDVVSRLPLARPLVVATGPLTGDALAEDLAHAVGESNLAYYDAIAPIVAGESIQWGDVFKASRWDKGGDHAYVNCPLNREQYTALVQALREAERVQARAFEDLRCFEGCLPVEVMAERGLQTLAFGPMKPVGLVDPRTGRQPYAVVQLRQEDQKATAWNLVGFQTRMTRNEQRRVFALIPGLQGAVFERFGSVHRNTFVNSPKVLDQTLQLRSLKDVYLAGQITGVEGYVESAACGLCLGMMLADRLLGLRPQPRPPPSTTALGALLGHLSPQNRDYQEGRGFQPSNITWSMFAAMPGKRLKRRERHQALAQRALEDLEQWLKD